MFDESRVSDLYGGNKVRKLEVLLAEARRRQVTDLVTLGAAGSHHVLATALHGAAIGLATHATLVPQPSTAHVRANLSRTAAATQSLTLASTWPTGMLRAGLRLLALRASGRATMWIGPGGSRPSTCAAWADAATALASALPTSGGERWHVFVALGSGGTAAGLAAGLGLAGIDAKVVGVDVVGWPVSDPRRVRQLARATARWITAHGGPAARPAPLTVDRSWRGRGYGTVDARVEGVIARAAAEGLQLDPTYTARALGACLEHLDQPGARAVYVHTLSATHPDAEAALSPRLSRLLR